LQFAFNQQIFIPDSLLFTLTHSLTLEAYINVSSFSAPQQLIVGDQRGQGEIMEIITPCNARISGYRSANSLVP
jgi:hypothetical protein